MVLHNFLKMFIYKFGQKVCFQFFSLLCCFPQRNDHKRELGCEWDHMQSKRKRKHMVKIDRTKANSRALVT
jgi:hypothetical protein